MLHRLLRVLISLVLFPAALLVSCGGEGNDDTDECEESISLKAWCDDDEVDQCRGVETYDAALEKLAGDCSDPEALFLATCGDTTLVGRSGGFGGRTLGFDGEGKLVYATWTSDAIEACPAPSGGRPPSTEECSLCTLCVDGLGLHDGEACDPKRAPWLAQACMSDASDSFQGDCRACACNECYPSFAPGSEHAETLEQKFASCAMERCDACADLALEADALQRR